MIHCEEFRIIKAIDKMFPNSSIRVRDHSDYIEVSWRQSGSEGGNTRRQWMKTKRKKEAIQKMCGAEFMEFWYGCDRQAVFFRHLPSPEIV